MPDLGLQSFNKLYPMMIRKYQDLVVDQNASEKDKINSIIQKLNALGKLSNDVVRDWNTVYNWAMNDGLNTDVSNKLEEMRANGEISQLLQNIYDSLVGSMSNLHTSAKDLLVNAINEVDDLAKANQTAIATVQGKQTTDEANIATNTANITTNTANIATNTANIATNTANIASNTSALAQNTTLIKNITVDVTDPQFGAKFDGTTNDSTAVQAAIDYVYSKGGGVVNFPIGTCIAEFILRDKVTLRGRGMRSTYIKAVSGSSKTYAITLDTGAVTHVNVEDLCIQGNGNATQGGILIEGNKGTQASGGLWYSNFKNVEVRSFLATCWHFRGGYDSTQVTPNQFIKLDGCNGYRSTNGIALKMEGQSEHFTFINCEFSSGSPSDKGTGTNIVLQRKRDTDGTTVMGDGAPNVVTFLGCTTQNANIGFSIERAYHVVIDNCWLENLYQAVTVFTSAKATIRDCNFTNAGSNGSGGGFCINNSSSHVSAVNNFFQGSQDVTFKAGTPTSFETRNNKGTITTSGLTLQTAQSSGANSCNGIRTVLVNASGTNITTVNTDLNVGESITLVAWGGAVTFAEGGNLSLGGSPVTLQNKQSITLTKFDLGVTLVLTGKSIASVKTGTLTYNGDGTSTSKTIAHGLGVIPSYYHVELASNDAGVAGKKYATVDATNITVYYNTAPISGTNNVSLNWKAEA